MAFQLKHGESVAVGVKRLMRRELARVSSELKVPRHDVDELVHRIRQSVKKTRAVLRLTRRGLGKRIFRSMDKQLGRISRRFSTVRDAKAILNAFHQLDIQADYEIPAGELDEICAALNTHLQILREHDIEIGDGVRKTRTALCAARRRIADLRIAPGNWSLIGRGFSRAYAAGRREFAKVTDEPSMERIHEWRKQVKCLTNQLHALDRVRAPSLKAFRDDLHELGETTGSCRDLLLLRSVFLQEPFPIGGEPIKASIIQRLDARLLKLHAEATVDGGRLYAAEPKVMRLRIKSWWRQLRPH